MEFDELRIGARPMQPCLGARCPLWPVVDAFTFQGWINGEWSIKQTLTIENRWKINGTSFFFLNEYLQVWIFMLFVHRWINFQNYGHWKHWKAWRFWGFVLWWCSTLRQTPCPNSKAPRTQKRRCLKWHNKTANMKVISDENDKTQFSCHVGWAVSDLRMNERPDFSHVHGKKSQKKRAGMLRFLLGIIPTRTVFGFGFEFWLSPKPCS